MLCTAPAKAGRNKFQHCFGSFTPCFEPHYSAANTDPNIEQFSGVQVLELKEQDVDVDSVLAENMRMQLYETHVAEVLSSGAGHAVDTERLLQGLPSDLKLDVKIASAKAKQTAKGKTRSTMVQVRSGDFLHVFFSQVSHTCGPGLSFMSRVCS